MDIRVGAAGGRPGLATPARAEAAVQLPGVRCVVLGVGGFLGGALAQALDEAGAIVHGFGRTLPTGRNRYTGKLGTFEDATAVSTALRGQDVVFHLVGSSLPNQSNRQPAADLAREVLPTIRLLELCRDAGVRRVVFASSGGTVYGPAQEVPTPESAPTAPISAYGINKLMVERYLGLFYYLHGLEYQVLRLANPYGPGQSPFRQQGIVAVMLHRALTGGAVELWGTGTVTRDFVHVRDVARAFVLAASYRGPHRVMNIGSEQGRTLMEVVSDLTSVLGLPHLPVLLRDARAADVPISVLDTSLARRELHWAPEVPWLDGLAGTADWMRTIL